ncbi:bifunctional phosphopantothenoylcysteine decarboxylase/phosphopantothenate--cysteine ligase CoaBC [Kangiella sediminilitoris]|uniref:Coenzyme A biosynthesis bifunctional protein CoaBC n=1 Tax=Kangiella sediminilitoris TaxID=1144748 RepID=A0A1B3B8K9_9GAMM|nr:bifunctional phosphopantothenoylcysteine decarboxylase/phosphopantothenate--cysteine ligase CoaBC [Kangiella sediminilitoris]AOE49110.1 Phosphopantothenoylcysteine decarboxylase/phosphopantothenate/cysteine ligase [Kangiella sediminilitoris]
MSLQGKKILLGITGGIAAYKSAELSRLLIKAGAEVRCVMTQGAKAFITPMTFQALTGNPVHEHLLDSEAEAAMGHIELARWADLVLIAPATADILSKLTVGAADDLLTTLCLATAAPVAVAPAMNQQMWANAATQNNVRTLVERGIPLWGPESGDQACGDVGPGRMLEPAELVKHVERSFVKQTLKGQHWVITAGPTVEAIDPVRYLANRSSGKMGYAVADMAAKAGAKVTLVSGPVCLEAPTGVKRIKVESAQAMLEAVQNNLGADSVFVSCAAVADYRPTETANQKMKKSGDEGLSIELMQNPDILRWVAKNSSAFCVGFAAETQNVSDYAKSKMQRKGISMICANDVSRCDIGFSCDDNELQVFYIDNGNIEERQIGPASKSQVAEELIKVIEKVRHSNQ